MPTTPDYIRIADEIVAAVRARVLRPGDKLPSFAQMSQKYDVSPSTLQMAYVRLEALGVIRRHQGKGVFVTDPATWMRPPAGD
jgi:GntR family transcriptional regulator